MTKKSTSLLFSIERFEKCGSWVGALALLLEIVCDIDHLPWNSGVRFPGWKTVRSFLRKKNFRDGRRPSRGPDALMCISSILHFSGRDSKMADGQQGQPDLSGGPVSASRPKFFTRIILTRELYPGNIDP